MTLVEREVGATRARVLAPGAEIGPSTLTVPLPRGFVLAVDLTSEPADRSPLAAKLAALVETFEESLSEIVSDAASKAERPPPAEALHEELGALADTAGAIDAVVIDASSKVTWGAARGDSTAPTLPVELAEVIHLDRAVRPIRAKQARPRPTTGIDAAVGRLRSGGALEGLAGGKALSIGERDGTPPFVARSFATIYVLVLVFDAPFDELRVERALQARMPIVERLVVALPPLDPTPTGGATAAARRAR